MGGTANVGGQRYTNASDAVAPTDLATLRQIQNQAFGVANKAALVAIDTTSIAAGAQRYVATYRRWFTLRKGATLTAVDGEIFAPTIGSVGDFWIWDGGGDPGWAAETQWEWDPAAGDDEATGRPGAPVKSHREIDRRWGLYPVLADTTVRLLGNTTEVPVVRRMPPGTGLAGGIAPGSSALYYTCTPVLRDVTGSGGTTGTITSVPTLENKTTNTVLSVTSSGMSAANAWTALGLVDRAIRIFRAGVPVATSFVQKDLGAKTAQLGQLFNISDAPQLCAFGQGLSVGSVQAGDTFQVLSRFSMPAPVVPSGQFVVAHGVQLLSQNVGIINAGLAFGPGVFHANFCEMGNVVANPGACPSFLTACYIAFADLKSGTFGRITSCHLHQLNLHQNTWELGDVRIFGNGAGGDIKFEGYFMPDPVTGIDIGQWDSTNGVVCYSSQFLIEHFWGTGNGTLQASLTLRGNGNRVVLRNTPVIVNSLGDARINGVLHAWSESLPIIDMPSDNYLMLQGAV
jgi:hypothetical protein